MRATMLYHGQMQHQNNNNNSNSAPYCKTEEPHPDACGNDAIWTALIPSPLKLL